MTLSPEGKTGTDRSSPVAELADPSIVDVSMADSRALLEVCKEHKTQNLHLIFLFTNKDVLLYLKLCYTGRNNTFYIF